LGEDVPDRGSRDRDAELAQLASDPQVAPTAVLAREPQDQLAHLTADWRPSGTAVRVGPAAGDQLPMPAQQRLRLNHERLPAASRQDPAQRREQQPVVRLESRLTDLPTEDRQLVPEHENLELLRPVTPSEEHDQLQQPTDDGVQQRYKQRRPPAVGPADATAASLAHGRNPNWVSAPHEIRRGSDRRRGRIFPAGHRRSRLVRPRRGTGSPQRSGCLRLFLLPTGLILVPPTTHGHARRAARID
jgi:hypothetical protein